MTTRYRTIGFIFKKDERGESDRIFSVFTKDFGRVELYGRAIRKINSKLRAGIDIFYFSEVEFIQGKNKKTLTDAFVVQKLKGTINNFRAGFKISEALDKFIKGQEPDKELFDLLNEVLEKLNSYRKHDLTYYYFIWNFLALQGYGLNFELKKIINQNVEKILQIIFEKDWQSLLKLKIEPASQKMLAEVSEFALNSFCPS